MGKTELVVGAGIILVLTGTIVLAPVKQQETSRWQKYRNPSLGIELEYPNGWEVKEVRREFDNYKGSEKGVQAYAHIYLMGPFPANRTSYDPPPDIVELYSKAELLNPYYDEFDEGDGAIDDRGLWDEFSRYIHGSEDYLYHGFRVVAYSSDSGYNNRSLYRDKDDMIGLRQFDCYAGSIEKEKERAKQCPETFMQILNSIRFVD